MVQEFNTDHQPLPFPGLISTRRTSVEDRKHTSGTCGPEITKFDDVIIHSGIGIPPLASVGFAGPINDAKEGPLDLNQHLILHPAATFFVRVEGESMEGAGIFSGDILIVDRSLKVTSGRIVIAVIDSDFMVKRIILRGSKIILKSEHPSYGDIIISYPDRLFVWGVVTYVIHGV